jgi:hypothetical protein
MNDAAPRCMGARHSVTMSRRAFWRIRGLLLVLRMGSATESHIQGDRAPNQIAEVLSQSPPLAYFAIYKLI